jgi:hypothetical protein
MNRAKIGQNNQGNSNNEVGPQNLRKQDIKLPFSSGIVPLINSSRSTKVKHSERSGHVRSSSYGGSSNHRGAI